MRKLTPGDEFYILVAGNPVLTIIDDHGVQRFPQNDCLRYLIDSGMVDLNRLAIAFNQGQIDLSGFLEFYMGIGYSVAGFDEIFGPSSSFVDNGNEPIEIINPLWLDDD